MRILILAILCLFLCGSAGLADGTRSGFYVRGTLVLDEGSKVSLSGQGVSDDGVPSGSVTVDVIGFNKKFEGSVTLVSVIKDATQSHVEATGQYAGQPATLLLDMSLYGRRKCVNALCVMQGGVAALRVSSKQTISTLLLYSGGKR